MSSTALAMSRSAGISPKGGPGGNLTRPLKPPRKSMSTGGVKQVAAPPVPQEGLGMGPSKKPPGGGASSNGSGPAPLTYSSGEPADDVNMNEVDDRVSLDVYLPTGKSVSLVVDSNIPMRDLLVHLAAKCKVSPSGHTLQVVDEETGKPVDYKPSQTFGSLGATCVYIVPKNKKPDWSKAAKANKAAKSFEITQRFTINLPGGQKAVMRVSPQLTLEQVFARVCQDKSLDSRRYTPQHPVNPLAPLDLKATIAESKLNGINLIHAGASSNADASRSMPDLHKGTMAATASQDPSSWYMPGAGETKKKKGFLSFLSKSKDKKFKPQEAHYSAQPSPAFTANQQRSSAAAAPVRKPTTPPPERRNADSHVAVRPKTMYVTPPTGESFREQSLAAAAAPADSSEDMRSSTLKGAGRKRPAPPPPQKAHAPPLPKTSVDSDNVKASVAAPVASASTPTVATSATSPTSLSVKPGAEASAATAGVSRLHSRNSSDSSGYHELTLSGADSPEAARVPTTFKTSIDTTSIESTDNLNGDSGIQETSPVSAESSSRLPGNGQVVTGKGVAVSKQQQTAASNTLSGPDKPKPLPSTKKKKAPPPPPGKAKETPAQTSASNQTPIPRPVVAASIPEVEDIPPPLTMDVDVTDSPELPKHAEQTPSIHSEEDNQSVSESGEPFNLEEILEGVVFDEEPLHSQEPLQPPPAYREEDQETEEDTEEMVMMETGSVLSEEVQMPDDIKSRPCEFIPPPPPIEPPPPEEEEEASTQVELQEAPQYVDKGTVVGDDNSSLAPASLKSSPVATHRRSDSHGSVSSLGSVDTIQGLSLEFEQTIAAGQEALDLEPSFEEEGSGYTTEMARFVAEMSRLTTDNNLQDEVGEPSSNNTSISLPDTESASDTGSVIRHGVPSNHVRGDSKDSQQSSLSSLGRPGDTSSLDGDHGSEHSSTTVCPPPQPSNAFAMTEEIPAPLETVPPPLEFQNGGNEEEEEEEEEEEFTTVTEEYIVPMGPGGLDYSAAMKVSEAEEKGTAIVEKRVESSSTGVFRAEPLSILQRAERDVAAEAERKKHSAPAEPAKKEEYVLTSEDLSCVSLVPLRPKVYSQPKVARAPSPPPPEPETLAVYYPGEPSPGLGSPEHSHVHLAYVSDHGHVHPVSKDSYESSTDFTAPYSHEGDHGQSVEEPSGSSQSTPYLPSMRITGGSEPLAFSDDDLSSVSSSDPVYRSSAKMNLESRTPPDNLSESGSEHAGSRRVSNASSHGVVPQPALDDLQVQYSALQDQFVLWQQQLQQNQTLLAAHSSNGATGDSSNDATLRALQMQMQMQQQMMQQLQVSMQALSQQQRAVQQNSPSPQPVAVAAPPPAPPAPVVAPAQVRKAETTKEKTRPQSSRFQPQLDPREELMIAIRSFGGHGGLNRVPAKATTWAQSNK